MRWEPSSKEGNYHSIISGPSGHRRWSLARDVLTGQGCYRVLSRASWSSREASRILLGLVAKAFVPEGGPLVVGIDETLERRYGKPHPGSGQGLGAGGPGTALAAVVARAGASWLNVAAKMCHQDDAAVKTTVLCFSHPLADNVERREDFRSDVTIPA